MVTSNKKSIVKKTLIFVTIISVLCFGLILYLIKEKNIAIISYGSNNEKCIVQKTKLDKNEILEKYSQYENIKIDEVISITKIKKEELKNKIREPRDNYFNYGISFDENFNQFLLKEEINSKELINYKEKELKIEEMNNYFLEENKNIIEEIPDEIWVFKTKSYYCENEKWEQLTEKNGYNIREFKNSKEQLTKNINLLSERIKKLSIDDGKYIYGVKTNTGEYLWGYNILRHSGTTWSQILAYKENPNEETKKQIEKSIEYVLNNNVIEYDNQTIYIKDEEEIKLGGNALTLLMLTEYQTTFSDNKYSEISNKISNGILKMQNDDGSFNHVYNLDFSLKEKQKSVFYDGEAIFALIKKYEINKDEKIYIKVTKSINYFIEQKYTEYGDHWISYGLSEYLKYNNEDKYIDFALKNYTLNRANINTITAFNPTKLEMLLSTYNSYAYIQQLKPDNEIIQKFNIENLKKSINIQLEKLYAYYIYPEVAMYLNNPNEVLYGFHNIEYRMRIDDIQHAMTATILYKNIDNF